MGGLLRFVRVVSVLGIGFTVVRCWGSGKIFSIGGDKGTVVTLVLTTTITLAIKVITGGITSSPGGRVGRAITRTISTCGSTSVSNLVDYFRPTIRSICGNTGSLLGDAINFSVNAVSSLLPFTSCLSRSVPSTSRLPGLSVSISSVSIASSSATIMCYAIRFNDLRPRDDAVGVMGISSG